MIVSWSNQNILVYEWLLQEDNKIKIAYKSYLCGDQGTSDVGA